MTLNKVIIAPLVTLTFAGGASAQDLAQETGAYIGVGATSYEFDVYGVDVKAGYNFNRYFGVEAQGVLGLTTESSRLCASPQCATIKTEVDYTLGAFAVGRLPLSEQFEIFARGGIHTTQYSFEINNAANSKFKTDDTGLAVGGGLQYQLNAESAIRAEYTYLDKSDANTVSLGYVRKF